MKLNTQSLLIIALGLVSIKWGVLPLITWQNERLAELQQQSQLLARSQRIIDDAEQYVQVAAQLNQYLTNSNSFFYTHQTDTRLNIQREIETLFAEQEIFIEGFNWLTQSVPLVENQSNQLTAKINFTGRLHHWLELNQMLTSDEQRALLSFDELRVQSTRGNGSIDEFRGYVVVSAFETILAPEALENTSDASEQERASE